VRRAAFSVHAKTDRRGAALWPKSVKSAVFACSITKSALFAHNWGRKANYALFDQKVYAKIGRAASNFMQASSYATMDCLQLFQFLHFCTKRKSAKTRTLC